MELLSSVQKKIDMHLSGGGSDIVISNQRRQFGHDEQRHGGGVCSAIGEGRRNGHL